MKVSERTQCQDQLSMFRENPTAAPGWYELKENFNTNTRLYVQK
jgi:hypothetical protein